MKVQLSSDFVRTSETNNSRENTDVLVQLKDGNKYIASFFTIEYVNRTMQNSMRTGEFLDGKYFWDKNMVVVKDCTLSTIKPVVQHLIDEGEFEEAFEML